MRQYTCKVRLKGEVKDEVRKIGVTAAEIKILKAIHGDDAVVEIVAASAEIKRTHDEERDRLEGLYGEKIIAQNFGAKHINFDAEVEDAEIEDVAEEPAPLPVATRKKIEPAAASILE